MPSLRRLLGGLAGSLLLMATATAQEAPLPAFQPLQVLTDTQLNALVNRINSQGTALVALQAALAKAQTEIAALRTQLESQGGNQQLVHAIRDDLRRLQEHPVLTLANYMVIRPESINGLAGPHLMFHGVNVHIQSGTDATNDQGHLQGLGNLVLGYNEEPAGLQAGERSGSHNLIVGAGHRYSSVAGLVAGEENTISGTAATVTGGHLNFASGAYASISGGVGLQAALDEAWVSGGLLTLVLNDLSTFGLVLDEIDGDLSDAESAIATVQGLLSTIQDDLGAVQASVSMKAEQSDFSTLQSEVLFTQENLVTVASEIQALQSDLATKADQSEISGLQQALATKAAQSALDAVQQDVEDIQQNAVLALGDYVEVVEHALHGLAGPHLLFQGLNVHLRSGSNATDDGGALRGLGNLVLGYNEEPTGLQAGERHGSHNLIVGYNHRYSSFGGLVAGEENTISGPAASISGGSLNTASGNRASVSGGSSNIASGADSCVSGGNSRQAAAIYDWAAGSLFEDH